MPTICRAYSAPSRPADGVGAGLSNGCGACTSRCCPRHERNTLDGAVRNISHHYDLSNELFALFLDETMTYSCAVFEPGDSLERAQRRKFDAICDLAEIGPRHHVLEIGTGWGGMAIHAAARCGCRVTTATISRGSVIWRGAGSPRLGWRIVWRWCCATTANCAAGTTGSSRSRCSRRSARSTGRLLRQLRPAAGTGRDRGASDDHDAPPPLSASRRGYTWIHKYIFPGGLIPSSEAIDATVAADLDTSGNAAGEIGHHYVPTLGRWRERFLSRLDDVHALGFNDVFLRMWDFYLAYCEAGFARAPSAMPRCGWSAAEAGQARVWITGASSGIGAALAEELAGAAPRGGDQRTPRRPARGAGAGACWSCRSTSPTASGARSAAATGEAELGGIDLAILNAGTGASSTSRPGTRISFAATSTPI